MSVLKVNLSCPSTHPITCSLILVCLVLFAEAEELGSREIEIESKTFIIEVKSNDQGRFVKILEVWRETSCLQACAVQDLTVVSLSPQMQTQGRGRIIFSVEKALEFRTILSEFVAEYERLGPGDSMTESERLRT